MVPRLTSRSLPWTPIHDVQGFLALGSLYRPHLPVTTRRNSGLSRLSSPITAARPPGIFTLFPWTTMGHVVFPASRSVRNPDVGIGSHLLSLRLSSPPGIRWAALSFPLKPVTPVISPWGRLPGSAMSSQVRLPVVQEQPRLNHRTCETGTLVGHPREIDYAVWITDPAKKCLVEIAEKCAWLAM